MKTALEIFMDDMYRVIGSMAEQIESIHARLSSPDKQLEVDEDWLIAKANAVLYALRRRFRSRVTTRDTAMMRDLLADVVMAAGVKVKASDKT